VSTLLHAAVYMFLLNLLNVLVRIANKMGLKKSGNQQSIAMQLLTQQHSNIFPVFSNGLSKTIEPESSKQL
jgi:hypothetical protein